MAQWCFEYSWNPIIALQVKFPNGGTIEYYLQ